MYLMVNLEKKSYLANMLTVSKKSGNTEKIKYLLYIFRLIIGHIALHLEVLQLKMCLKVEEKYTEPNILKYI